MKKGLLAAALAAILTLSTLTACGGTGTDGSGQEDLPRLVIASDNFHQYRGQLFARQAGLTPQSAGCFSPWFLGAGYACREVVGILAVWAGIR